MRTLLAPVVAIGLAACSSSSAPLPGSGETDDAVDLTQAIADLPLVTCSRTSSGARCELEPSRAPLRIKRVLVGQGSMGQYIENIDGECEVEGDECPSRDLATFEVPVGGTISATFEFDGLESQSFARFRADMDYPSSSRDAVAMLPFEFWPVTFTVIGEESFKYLFKYNVQAPDDIYFGSSNTAVEALVIKTASGSAGETSKTVWLPVFEDTTLNGYLMDIAVTGDPHFEITAPGCYLAVGGGPPLVDTDCASAVFSEEPASCTDGDCPCDGFGEGEEDCECVGDDCPEPEGPLCVAGTSSSCSGANETWDSELALCCVADGLQCVAGSSSPCGNAGADWTGELCCVDETFVCAAGNSSSCAANNEHYVGDDTCCVEAKFGGNIECVSGNSSSCTADNEYYVGDGTCCVEAKNAGELHCVSGNSSSCTAANEYYVGDGTCCVETQYDGDFQCVSGNSSSCSGDNEYYVGNGSCCVEARLGGDLQCVSGSSSSCSGDNEYYVGDGTCCVEAEDGGNLQCVTGSSSSCSGTGETWTGDLCCVDDALTCTPGGSSSSCDGLWTGKECCE